VYQDGFRLVPSFEELAYFILFVTETPLFQGYLVNYESTHFQEAWDTLEIEANLKINSKNPDVVVKSRWSFSISSTKSYYASWKTQKAWNVRIFGWPLVLMGTFG
jgi:hypothetical protein